MYELIYVYACYMCVCVFSLRMSAWYIWPTTCMCLLHACYMCVCLLLYVYMLPVCVLAICACALATYEHVVCVCVLPVCGLLLHEECACYTCYNIAVLCAWRMRRRPPRHGDHFFVFWLWLVVVCTSIFIYIIMYYHLTCWW